MRKAPREYHTRFGWWVMTHDRGGPAVIGAGAGVVLVADLVYAALHWSGSFPRAFLVSLIALVAVGLISFALRFIWSRGGDRRAKRWNQRGANFAVVVLIVAFLEVSDRLGGSDVGWILGAVAGLTGGFVLYTAAWLTRQRQARVLAP